MSRADGLPDDPRALIVEAYRIEGLGVEDARSIFFDWALGLPQGQAPGLAAARLLAALEPPEDHPMTALLREAVEGPAGPSGRRGRRRSRG